MNDDHIFLYNKAIEGRNHHYSNYNYWMNFFAIIIGALFVAYYTINSSDSTAGQADTTNMEIAITLGENTASAVINQTDNSAKNIKVLHKLIPLLGFFATFCWFLSFRGYYHWMVSWINVVRFYEQKLGGNVHVYALHYNGTGFWNQNISTQKVFQIFLIVLMLAWIHLFCSTLYENCTCCRYLLGASLILVTFILLLMSEKCLKSNVNNYHKLIPKGRELEIYPPEYKEEKSCCRVGVTTVIILLFLSLGVTLLACLLMR